LQRGPFPISALARRYTSLLSLLGGNGSVPGRAPENAVEHGCREIRARLEIFLRGYVSGGKGHGILKHLDVVVSGAAAGKGPTRAVRGLLDGVVESEIGVFDAKVLWPRIVGDHVRSGTTNIRCRP
jgi:hypothetical protein